MFLEINTQHFNTCNEISTNKVAHKDVMEFTFFGHAAAATKA